jgi:hypothetical protein
MKNSIAAADNKEIALSLLREYFEEYGDCDVIFWYVKEVDDRFPFYREWEA